MAGFSVIEHVFVYHGAISKATTERILGAVGRDGSHLLRDSESVAYTYCLCMSIPTVFQIKEGPWTVEVRKEK
uniref:SH2 domain-containing protein n=1 Tax=Hucho hucho TaxID=62062 RepID=A0A4W5LUG9_9TELE